MSKTRLLTIVVILLLLLNLGTLGFIMFRQHHRPHRGEGPKRLIIEKLHLDPQQQKQYEQLIRWHRSNIDTLDLQILETKNRLYSELLKTNVNEKTEDSLINVIVDYQQQIEEIHFKHFQDIKKICKPDQLQYYNSLTEELSQLFSKPPRRKHD